jgi:predicted dehydrogenase
VFGWLEHPAGEVTAVYDVDDATRTRRAAQWGCRAYASLDEMLADPNVDAVEILTPHHLHASQAIAALRAGKHVSLQKPPTRSLVEFDEVAAAAAEAGTTFKVYENFMFYPPHVLARSLIDAGEIGVVRKRPFSASRALGGRVGRGRVAASVLRLGSARGSRPGDTLVGIRVGELGGCGVHLRADSSGTGEAATATR